MTKYFILKITAFLFLLSGCLNIECETFRKFNINWKVQKIVRDGIHITDSLKTRQFALSRANNYLIIPILSVEKIDGNYGHASWVYTVDENCEGYLTMSNTGYQKMDGIYEIEHSYENIRRVHLKSANFEFFLEDDRYYLNIENPSNPIEWVEPNKK